MYKNTQKKDNETITPDKERICETTDKMKPSKKPVQHIRKVLTTSAVMCCIIAILFVLKLEPEPFGLQLGIALGVELVEERLFLVHEGNALFEFGQQP